MERAVRPHRLLHSPTHTLTMDIGATTATQPDYLSRKQAPCKLAARVSLDGCCRGASAGPDGDPATAAFACRPGVLQETPDLRTWAPVVPIRTHTGARHGRRTAQNKGSVLSQAGEISAASAE